VTTIAPRIIEEVVDRLVVEFRPERIYLFGSHAWGDPDSESDLDLMVVVDSSEESSYRRAVRAHRCLRGIGMAKDVMVRTRAEVDRFREERSSLTARIVSEGVLLHERAWSESSTSLEL
jgi:predicted nucleotidyltransferase